MKKILLLAYNGEPSCFAHVMLYALDLEEKGHEVKVIIEGAATALIVQLAEPGVPFANLYSKLKEKELLYCVCKACCQKMGSLAAAEQQGLTIIGDMQGHPSIANLLSDGFEAISF